MRMALEALETGELRVRRDDAPELQAIRDGQLSYASLIELANDLEAQVSRASARTRLPDDVSLDEVDSLALELMQSRR